MTFSHALIEISGSKSDPDWIQTNDPQLRRLLLYSAELPDQNAGAKIIFN